jgi:hypothetical protein
LTKTDVDEAFEWLVLIVGIVSAIMSQYPAYFYTLSPSQRDPSLTAARAIVPPLIITILIWLVGKLSTSKRVQVLAKVVAWMVVIGVTWVNVYNYLIGLMWASGFQIEIGIANDIFLMPTFGFLCLFMLPLVFTYFVVVPKYRQIYPDSTLLTSKVRFIAAYVATQIFLLALVISLQN